MEKTDVMPMNSPVTLAQGSTSETNRSALAKADRREFESLDTPCCA